MAWVFGATTGDRIDCGSAASLDNIWETTGTASALMWLFPTTITANRALFGKGASRPAWLIATAGGAVSLNVARATTNLIYASSNNPLTTNKWWFKAVTLNINNAANTLGHLYWGDLATIVTEHTYSATTDGAGAFTSDAAANFIIGNLTGFTVAFQGRIAVFAMFNRELSLGEIRRWQFNPTVLSGCVLYYHLGFFVSNPGIDWSGSGNNAVGNQGSLGNHVPLGSPFGYGFGWQGAFTAAAAGNPWSYYAQLRRGAA